MRKFLRLKFEPATLMLLDSGPGSMPSVEHVMERIGVGLGSSCALVIVKL